MTTRPARRGWHPSLPAILLLLFVVLIPIVDGNLMVNADGDPARHLRHGETILVTGEVIRTDSFSYTASGKSFIGFEFGSQILFALSYRLAGLPGVVLLAGLCIAATIALLTSWLISRHTDPLLAVMAGMLVAILTYIHWLARPHVLSWPLVILLLAMLESRPRPSLWRFGILFVVWVNLHGAFLFGALMIGMYLMGHMLDGLTSKDPEVRRLESGRVRALAPVLPVIALATLVNPYGWHLPVHLVAFFGDTYLRDATNEFLSPDFHSADLRPFLAALLLTMILFARSRRLSWTHLLVVVGTAGMALISQRNIIFFALVGVPLLVLNLAPAWDRIVVRRMSVVARFGVTARTGATAPYVALAIVLVGLLGASGGTLGGREFIARDFDPVRFPVEAVRRAREAGLTGKIFHEFTWGGYLVWAWPEQRVFIDGGTDFYGSDLLRTHRAIIGLRPGWRDSLAVRGIDLVLVRATGSLAAELLRDPRWTPWHRDSTAVLLRRVE